LGKLKSPPSRPLRMAAFRRLLNIASVGLPRSLFAFMYFWMA
jgi:hypothetical protein